jgi:hypothetical protein
MQNILTLKRWTILTIKMVKIFMACTKKGKNMKIEKEDDEAALIIAEKNSEL